MDSPAPRPPFRPPPAAHRMIEHLRAGETYGFVLALIVVGYVLMAFLEDGHWSRVLLSTMVSAILLLTLHASHTRGPILRIVLVIGVVSVTLSIFQAVTGATGWFQAGGYVMFALLVVAPVAITARIARHPVVNLETILGALCAYLLIGMLFAGLYRAADTMGSGAFFVQTPDPTPVKYLYFSFITLTTLGFGDLTPATDGGRVIVSFEALIGQVFLVTIVASLISSYGRRRPGARAADDAAEPGPDDPGDP